jgi:hypothetical protein
MTKWYPQVIQQRQLSVRSRSEEINALLQSATAYSRVVRSSGYAKMPGARCSICQWLPQVIRPTAGVVPAVTPGVAVPTRWPLGPPGARRTQGCPAPLEETNASKPVNPRLGDDLMVEPRNQGARSEPVEKARSGPDRDITAKWIV